MVPERAHPLFVRRLWGVVALIVTLFLFLLWRLGQIQLRHGEQFDESITRQTVRRIRLEPIRGRLFGEDAKTILVDNRACYDLVLHPTEMRQPGRRAKTLDFILTTCYGLADRLHRPTPITRPRLERHLRQNPALILPVFQQLSASEMAVLAELAPPPPGLEIVPRIVRTYPYPGLASHLLGFTGRRPPDETETEDGVRLAYALPELTGRDGLEKFYEQELAGRAGEKLVQVDILGYIHRQIGDPVAPVDGNDLVLTLNPRAQQAAQRALRGVTGAFVVIDVSSGAVVAMASAPGYDVSTITPKRYAELARDEGRRPLLNRAMSASYTPGSILKPLIALAALESGEISPGATVDCGGAYQFQDRAISCWLTGGHGPVDLLRAMERSCNTYFIHAGLQARFDRILPLLLGAGLGSRPEIDLPGAVPGIVPSREWALARWKHAWREGDTALLAIGQGPIAISPLQAALFTAAIANGGTVFRPHLVKLVRSAQGEERSRTAPIARYRLPVSQKQLNLVRRAMWEVVNSELGTGKSARNEYMTIAGKTGTAEVGSPLERFKNTWFIGFGPYENPRYAFAVLVERGESGGQTASPLAKRFFELWLGPDAEPD